MERFGKYGKLSVILQNKFYLITTLWLNVSIRQLFLAKHSKQRIPQTFSLPIFPRYTKIPLF